MNTTTITGRLARSPEATQTAGGTAVCELRIAVDDRDKTSFFPVTCYAKLAETAVQYLAKGRLIGVTGRLVNDEWTTAEGDKRSRMHIVARTIDFLDRPSAGNASPESADGTDDEEAF